MRLTTLGVIAAAWLWTGSANAGVCDVEVRTQFGLYFVTVDGMPFRNKGYVFHDDAVRLREALLQSGTCEVLREPDRCDIRPVSGGFEIAHRGTRYPASAPYGTYEAAYRQASKYDSARLCSLAGVPARAPKTAIAAAPPPAAPAHTGPARAVPAVATGQTSGTATPVALTAPARGADKSRARASGNAAARGRDRGTARGADQ